MDAAQHLPASCLNRMAQHQMGGGEGGGPGHEGSSPGGHGGGDPYGGAMNSLMPSMPGHDGAMMPGGGPPCLQLTATLRVTAALTSYLPLLQAAT